MESLATPISNGRESGGRSKYCSALLQTLGMCLSKNLDDGDSVSLEAIFRQIFFGVSRTAAQRIMKRVGEKRKRFEQKDLSFFCIVNDEALRWKYTE